MILVSINEQRKEDVMIRIAILEKEQWVKDILYDCVRLFAETEWSFVCYT